MSLEAMKQVTEAEQTTRAQKAEAEARAALRKRAEERLDQAADTIVGRVVKTDVHC